MTNFPYSRRKVLKWAMIAAASGVASPLASAARAEQVSFPAEPFSLGVASGDPTPDGAVIWTRLALTTRPGWRHASSTVEVSFEVAADDRFRQPFDSKSDGAAGRCSFSSCGVDRHGTRSSIFLQIPIRRCDQSDRKVCNRTGVHGRTRSNENCPGELPTLRARILPSIRTRVKILIL